jgi:hypothetical protein
MKGEWPVAFPFLSDEWVKEANRLRSESRVSPSTSGVSVRMNLVVTEAPFGDGPIRASLDTSSGEFELAHGHLDEPDITVTVDYVTAKTILVYGDPQAGIQAFMAGQVQIEGDMAKLLALQSFTPDDAGRELAARVREMTE